MLYPAVLARPLREAKQNTAHRPDPLDVWASGTVQDLEFRV